MPELHRCVGYTDRTFTVPCPEPPTCEMRVSRNGVWATWKKACDRHAAGAMEILGKAPGYEVERRALCADCPDVLRDEARVLGLEVTASTSEPAVAGPYTADPFICPHGVAYWIEPTGEQIAAWARDGVK
jgi:hypothetical protein